MESLFHYHPPTAPARPVLISVPHAGTWVPEDIADSMRPEVLGDLDDTDWFVDRLYDFAPAMGIGMLVARPHRYVIDVNRDPEGRPLYDDGRVITELVPRRTFTDEPIYRGAGPDEAEIARRRERYYDPYHARLDELIAELRERFGAVLLWDAHSIRRLVPTIRPTPFPDLILGSNSGRSAAPELIERARATLADQPHWQLSVDDPFRGGTITRRNGRPAEGLHALQLEMAKTGYMDDPQRAYDEGRADLMRERLQAALMALAGQLETP